MNRYDDWNLKENSKWREVLQCTASIVAAITIFLATFTWFVAVQ